MHIELMYVCFIVCYYELLMLIYMMYVCFIVLKYSSTKLKLRYMGKFRVLLRVSVLYVSIGPCNLNTKAKI